MKTVTSENLKIIINICIKNICKDQAKKQLAMTEAEAQSFGAFEETALEEPEKDKFYEDFVVGCFAHRPKQGEEYGQ